MRISFLLHNGYHYGGTIRATFTLAEELATRHEVEIVSVFRHRDRPALGLPADVTLRHLVDLREDSPGYDGDHPDLHRPAEVFPRGDGRWKQYSALSDARIGEYLRGVAADVLVATRPGLNVHLARQARRGPVLVGQEHLVLAGHSRRLRWDIGHEYRLLDAVTTLTEADARAYRRLALPGVRIEAVPDGVPAPALPPAGPVARTVVAAGRLPSALCGLVEDDELRAKTARAALASSERFDPVRIAARHEALWTELVDRGASRRVHSAGRARRHHEIGRAVDAVYALKARAGRLVRGLLGRFR
ncbi:hypothetical protein ACIGW7_28205 [Streptomyces sp. NPDC053253]|uniref:hypothetical protein n=1 Tax=Streptomyces sp. NPDC053253 TaxID=3365699 RepID=UPI0037CDBCBB